MSWRDELPPIPTERMLADAVSEGTRRVARRRRRRQRAIVIGGAGVAVAGLIAIASSGVFTRSDVELSGASDTTAPALAEPTETAAVAAAATTQPIVPATVPSVASVVVEEAEATAAAAGTVPAGTEAAGTAPAGTEAAGTAPAGTEAAGTAPAGTEAAGTEAAAAATQPASAPAGTASAAASTEPSGVVTSPDVTFPTQIWEQPVTGSCGPTTVEVTYMPQDVALTKAFVVWTSDFGVGQSSMDVADNVARATLGPFPAGTVSNALISKVFVVVVAVDGNGDVAIVRAPTDGFSLTACPR